MQTSKTVNIIIPCYNEEEVLPWSMGKLQEMLVRLKEITGVDGKIVLVNDGSRDNTWQLIEQFANVHNNVVGIKLAHNEGHQGALWAGMQESLGTCGAMISIDADLQDDENAIIDMVKQWKEGKDIAVSYKHQTLPTNSVV